MNKKWSELNKQFQDLIRKKDTFEQGKIALLKLREEMMSVVLDDLSILPLSIYSNRPFHKSIGYESKTMVYSLYHIARIEDIVCAELINNEEEEFFKTHFDELTNSPIITTGNELHDESLDDFSKKLDVKMVVQYLQNVYSKSNKMIEDLTFDQLHRKWSKLDEEKILSKKVVSDDESANWLANYWCSKDLLGLLKMPFSRHWIMHIEAYNRIKEKNILR